MFIALAASAALTTHAQASIAISTNATANMSCAAGVCTATSAVATYNVNDLQTALATGNLELSTGTPGGDIDVRAPVSWSSKKTLTLDANHSIVFDKPIKVTGKGGLILAPNGGANGGVLQFSVGKSVSFASADSKLTIGGLTFKLKGSLAELGNAVQANQNGNYALMNDIDASKNGTYAQAPVGTVNGAFNGLGHVVSNLTISDSQQFDAAALFAQVGASGSVANLFVLNANITAMDSSSAGVVVGGSSGAISLVTATGTINAGPTTSSGGIVGQNNGGTVFGAYAKVVVNGGRYVGGLVGLNLSGSISQSAAGGPVTANDNGFGGGLVGGNFASVADCVARGNVTVGANAYGGGLVGDNYTSNAQSGIILTSYSTGTVTGTSTSIIGLSAGFNNADPPLVRAIIYDTTSGSLKTMAKPTGLAGPTDDPPVGSGDKGSFYGRSRREINSGVPHGYVKKTWEENPAETEKGNDELVPVAVGDLGG
jgi:hypothetical protein